MEGWRLSGSRGWVGMDRMLQEVAGGGIAFYYDSTGGSDAGDEEAQAGPSDEGDSHQAVRTT
jgi:hypothetical protein